MELNQLTAMKSFPASLAACVRVLSRAAIFILGCGISLWADQLWIINNASPASGNDNALRITQKINTNFLELYNLHSGVPFVLYGATNSLLPNSLLLTAGANISLSTNGNQLIIDGAAGGTNGSGVLDNADFYVASLTTNTIRTNKTLLNAVNATRAPFSADNTGAADASSAIQSAYNYASALGLPLYIPKGTYLINSTLNISNSNTRIFGDGFFATTLKGNTSGMGRIFYVNNSNGRIFNVDIRDIGCTSAVLASRPNGIEFANASQCNVVGYYGTLLNNALMIDGCENMDASVLVLSHNLVGSYQTRQNASGFGYANLRADHFILYQNTNASFKTDSAISKSIYCNGWIESSPYHFLLQNRSTTDAEMDTVSIKDIQGQNINGAGFDGGRFLSAQAQGITNYFVIQNLTIEDCKMALYGSSNAVEFIKGSNTNNTTAFHNIRLSGNMIANVTVGGVYSDTTSTDGRLFDNWIQSNLPAQTGSGDWLWRFYPSGYKFQDTNLSWFSASTMTAGNDRQDSAASTNSAYGFSVPDSTKNFYWLNNGVLLGTLDASTLTLSGYLTMKERSGDPSAPASAYRLLYPKSGGWYERSSSGTINGPFVGATRAINTANSLTGGGDLSADRTITLVNDSTSPGNNKYYGTGPSGTKGFFDIVAGAGDNVSVNGTSASDANLSDTTPAAPANSINAKWQKDSGSPNNVSANIPYASPLTVTSGNLTIANGSISDTYLASTFSTAKTWNDRMTFNGSIEFAQSSGDVIDFSSTGDTYKTNTHNTSFALTSTGTPTANATTLRYYRVNNTASSNIVLTNFTAQIEFNTTPASGASASTHTIMANSWAEFRIETDGNGNYWFSGPEYDNPLLSSYGSFLGSTTEGVVFKSGTSNTVLVATNGIGGSIVTSSGAIVTNETVAGLQATGIINNTQSASTLTKTDSTKKLVDAIIGTDYLTGSSTNTLTNKSFDSSDTGNTLKWLDYDKWVTPSFADETGAIINTNNASSALFGHATFSGSGATNANWVIYEWTVPDDFDSSVDLKVARFKYTTEGTSTSSITFNIGMQDMADSADQETISLANFSNWIVMTSSPSSPAAKDGFTISAQTLTSWKSNLTAGHTVHIMINRDGAGDANNDAVDDKFFVLSYGRTQ